MSGPSYSDELCEELRTHIAHADLVVHPGLSRHEIGDVLAFELRTVWPETRIPVRFRIERFVGGGFAGQVYRAILESCSPEGTAHGLKVGGFYAIKVLVPPSRFAVRFRNSLYWLAFQSPFSLQVQEPACRAGLLWQTFIRRALSAIHGVEGAAPQAYGSFYDEGLASFGDVCEWIDGRTWRLEPDMNPGRRRRWRSLSPEETESPEFVAKRQFMHRLVTLMHDMGAHELARQYEWWTMKSQPNVLKRQGAEAGPAAGLCAVDFRPGLALLPFLPMSPADLGLIVAGVRRGSFVQFDRPDLGLFAAFVSAHREAFGGLAEAVETLIRYENAYRRSMPDVTHQGAALLRDSQLRQDVRQGLVQSYLKVGLIDADFAATLDRRPGAFLAFQLLGLLPFAGRCCRRLWGNAAYRRDVGLQLASWEYACRAAGAAMASRLIDWHRAGRVGEERTRVLMARPGLFWLNRFTLGYLPAGMHRWCAEPSYAAQRVRQGWAFMRTFLRDAAFREQWLLDMVQRGHQQGMLHDEERELLVTQVSDPYIAKYLRSVGVHLATLPITQIISVLTGAVIFVYLFATGKATLATAAYWFGVVLAAFQLTPISPGSICRGLYVVYMMIKERNFVDYAVAAPLSFVKYIGYLAFPIQMAATYPVLSRFVASRWATDTVHLVPVFGERGALLEHAVFDMFFNRPRIFGHWARTRTRMLLDAWLVLGFLLLVLLFPISGIAWARHAVVNIHLAVICIFILPRVFFYPVLRRNRRRTIRQMAPS